MCDAQFSCSEDDAIKHCEHTNDAKQQAYEIKIVLFYVPKAPTKQAERRDEGIYSFRYNQYRKQDKIGLYPVNIDGNEFTTKG